MERKIIGILRESDKAGIDGFSKAAALQNSEGLPDMLNSMRPWGGNGNRDVNVRQVVIDDTVSFTEKTTAINQALQELVTEEQFLLNRQAEFDKNPCSNSTIPFNKNDEKRLKLVQAGIAKAQKLMEAALEGTETRLRQGR